MASPQYNGNKILTDIPPAAVFGPLSPGDLAVLRSWKRAGVPTCFVHTTRHVGSTFLKAVSDIYLPINSDSLDQIETKSRIVARLNQVGVRGVTAIGYANSAYLHSLRHSHGLKAEVYGPVPSKIVFMNSKLMQLQCASEAGLAYLPTSVVACGCNKPEPTPPYPIVARPDNPADFLPMFKMKVLHSPSDLEAFLNKFEKRDGKIVIQNFKKVPNLIVHGFRTINGCHGPMASFLVEHKLEGVSLAIRAFPPPDHILENCMIFCERAQIVGTYHFEFLYETHSQASYFLDFNGRLGGTTAKAYALGYDEPLAVLECFGHLARGAVRFDPCVIQPRLASSRVALTKAIERMLTGSFEEVDYLPYEGLRAVLQLVLGFICWKDELIDLRDPIGTLAYFYNAMAARH